MTSTRHDSMQPVITSRIVNRRALVTVQNAPPVTSTPALSDRVTTVHPVRIEFFDGIPDHADRDTEPTRWALVTGPYEKGDTLSELYRSVRADLTDPGTPDWLLGLAEVYLPEQPR